MIFLATMFLAAFHLNAQNMINGYVNQYVVVSQSETVDLSRFDVDTSLKPTSGLTPKETEVLISLVIASIQNHNAVQNHSNLDGIIHFEMYKYFFIPKENSKKQKVIHVLAYCSKQQQEWISLEGLIDTFSEQECKFVSTIQMNSSKFAKIVFQDL